LDVAYQRITLGDETEDGATIKGEIRPNKEQGKSNEEVKIVATLDLGSQPKEGLARVWAKKEAQECERM
jgi:hypothetical protein